MSPASQTSDRAIGVDFGTTNSSIACADLSGEVQLAKFPYLGSLTDSYRSLLYLQQTKVGGANTLKSWTGPEGIEQYLAADVKGRLIQSLKSFLSSRNLHSTEVFGRRHTIEDLIARILRDLREKAEHQFGIRIKSAVVGRPVHFVGAENAEDDVYAEERLLSGSRWPYGSSNRKRKCLGPHCWQCGGGHSRGCLRCEDHQAPRVSRSWSGIAVAFSGQDTHRSELGLYQARALAPFIAVARQGRAGDAERRSRAIARTRKNRSTHSLHKRKSRLSPPPRRTKS